MYIPDSQLTYIIVAREYRYPSKEVEVPEEISVALIMTTRVDGELV
jgi:hypothetical protein